ncbi:hypothetical protein EYZ11_004564 [Aspergillus tanneri]|uniref:Uncharacterized protein n=1 Tax=Aspergillus tanneri TaxID=1220188 RepID=A0A4S3JMK1_9EURO|nr:hypothetical protein EYZ11_004564 [Aspergillus tanneri]
MSAVYIHKTNKDRVFTNLISHQLLSAPLGIQVPEATHLDEVMANKRARFVESNSICQ